MDRAVSISDNQGLVFPRYGRFRPTERLLLIWVTLIFAAGVYLLFRIGLDPGKVNLIRDAGFICGSFWVLHLFLIITGEKGDEYFLPLAAFLIILGWLEIYRIDPSFAHRQMYWIFAGEACLVLWMRIVRDYRVLEDYKYLFLVIAIVLQVLVALFGTEVNGAKLWFRIGGFSLQPVEIIKIFLTIFLASFLKQNREIMEQPFRRDNIQLVRYFILLFVLWGAAELTLIVQKDLGMSLLLFGVFIGLFYIATRKWFLTFLGFVGFLGGSYVLYHLFPHVQARFNTWWNPWASPKGAGYQIIQALYSLGEGGLTGTGFGGGNPEFVPEIHTDFIFVALSEELGLVGALLILGAFMILIQRMFRTALESDNEISTYLASGLAILFATQVFIIIGGAVRFIPLTGITLPFMSYGGSSLVSNFILLGLFLQMSGRIRVDSEREVVPSVSGGGLDE